MDINSLLQNNLSREKNVKNIQIEDKTEGLVLENLKVSHLKDLLPLFVNCFENDPYYVAMFPDNFDRRIEMKQQFDESLLYCIEHNGAVGMFDNTRLIGFILFFDYKEIKENNKEKFERIFKGCDTRILLPYKVALHDRIDEIDGSVLFILSAGVSKNYRGRGIAKKLTQHILDSHPNAHVVTDISNKASLAICRKLNFRVKMIDTDYFYSHHLPSR